MKKFHIQIKGFPLLFFIFSIMFIIPACSDDDDSEEISLPLNTKVIMIGDSYFALGGYITGELENLSGERYRHYYISGAEMTESDSEITSIPHQYENAKSEDPDIRTVIMDGGGNDVLMGGGGWSDSNVCSDAESTDCQELVNEAMDTAEILLEMMLDDGVENIIYMFYPHLIENMAWVNDALDLALERAEIMCDTSDNCYLIDPIEAFSGHDEYFLIDHVHPSKAGGEVLANLIWDVMEENNIEQNNRGF